MKSAAKWTQDTATPGLRMARQTKIGIILSIRIDLAAYSKKSLRMQPQFITAVKALHIQTFLDYTWRSPKYTVLLKFVHSILRLEIAFERYKFLSCD